MKVRDEGIRWSENRASGGRAGNGRTRNLIILPTDLRYGGQTSTRLWSHCNQVNTYTESHFLIPQLVIFDNFNPFIVYSSNFETLLRLP